MNITKELLEEAISGLKAFGGEATACTVEKLEKILSKSLNTVNVIEECDGELLQLVSFEDSSDGNIEAERLFKKLVLESNEEISAMDLIIAIKKKYYHLSESDFTIMIVHSNF